MSRTSRRAPEPGRPPARKALSRALLLVAPALLALVVVGCSNGDAVTTTTAPSDSGPGYTNITPDELATMLENKDFVFVNTHVPYEGEIEQTDLFIDFERAAELVSELPADKNAKIVAYCRSDRMSVIAVEEWVKAGYTNLYNLEGGFVAWEDAGYELLFKDQ
ncbi:MAG: rhodanese-like domain-containing protein [Thermoleophilia bacterium]